MALVNLEYLENEIAVLTLNRPEKANAFSNAMLTDFKEAIQNLKPVRALLIAGSGGRVFSAGADLSERAGLSEDEVWPAVERIRSVCAQVAALKCPTIAVLNGAAFGGGLELALACDFRIAERGVKLGLTETSLGIIPGSFGTVRLTKLVGKSKAMELILLAKRIQAEEALEIGLVNQIAEDALRTSLNWAEQLAKNAPIAVQIAKEVIGGASDLPEKDAFLLEKEGYLKTIPTADRREGLEAFREKREAKFQGR
ncbi:enoyl-CoA hydratase-related protein [Listeria valentina]|uniref:enoyl-CoA hydratase-related protein n=1 Tax=Listeria valentina TaxID=2705293 RepID=UPI00143086F9|nr:enoyl-CoA hydratase-related protein [Listeria valentina]